MKPNPKSLVCLGALSVAALASQSALANVVGNLYVNGNGTSQVTFSDSAVTFSPTISNIQVTSTDLKYGSGLSLAAGTVGSVASVFLPLTTALNNFITFAAQGLDFTLAPGISASNYALTAISAGQTDIALSLRGTVTDGSGNTSNWIGAIDNTIQSPIATVAAGLSDGGIVTSFSGSLSTFVAPVPEPSTYALLVAGLGMFGVMLRRRSPR